MTDGTYRLILDGVIVAEPRVVIQNDHYFDVSKEEWVDVDRTPPDWTFELIDARSGQLEQIAARLSASLRSDDNFMNVGMAAQSRYNRGDKLLIYTKEGFDRSKYPHIFEGIPIQVRKVGILSAL
jgi:hypothetical protein